MMKTIHIHPSAKQLLTLAVSFTTLSLLIAPNVAAVASTSTTLTTTQQQHLSTIISRGDQEIARRLTQLNKLSSLITAATHLTATDKTSLSTEVSNEVTGLTALKAKLDAETTLTGAITDAQSIVTDYRVYALITPKVWLVKTADDQQTVEDKLTALAAKLQTRLDSAKSSGKDTTSAQTTLTDMTTQTKAAQAISAAMEAKVLPLLPTDFNSDHTILSGDYAQLKTAHTDNETAYSDAKTVISDLKTL
jgi:hypothetical protein